MRKWSSNSGGSDSGSNLNCVSPDKGGAGFCWPRFPIRSILWNEDLNLYFWLVWLSQSWLVSIIFGCYGAVLIGQAGLSPLVQKGNQKAPYISFQWGKMSRAWCRSQEFTLKFFPGEDPVSKWLLLLLFITFGSWVDYLDQFLLLVHIKWIFLLWVYSLGRTEHFQSFPIGAIYFFFFFPPILAAFSPIVLINVCFLLLKKEEKVNNL